MTREEARETLISVLRDINSDSDEQIVSVSPESFNSAMLIAIDALQEPFIPSDVDDDLDEIDPKHLVHEKMEEPDKSLEEAARHSEILTYPMPEDGDIEKVMKVQEARIFHEIGFKAGAEWQKGIDNNFERFKDYTDKALISLEEAREQGRQEMKRQILKDAVEACVNTYKDPVLSCGWAEFVVDMPSSETDKFGDKVRIVVLKEEEE